jgi:hypothetical protein
MPFAYIRYLRRHGRWGRPVDPGYGVEEGAGPDQGMPVDPDYGVDEGAGVGGGPIDPEYPDQALPGFPGRPGHGLPWPGRPVDPGFGWGDRERPDRPDRPGHLPAWPIRPGRPDLGLPPGTPDQGLPPEDPPPGTIWPPIPPDFELGFHGKAVLLAWIPRLGYRYVVVQIPETPPERPGRPEVDPTRRR